MTEKHLPLAEELLLVCPVCGDTYQHHTTVTIFDRLGGEDGQSMAMNSAHGTWVAIANADNPSSRRDAVRVHFWGECGHTWSLDFVQHKGQTFVTANLMVGTETST